MAISPFKVVCTSISRSIHTVVCRVTRKLTVISPCCLRLKSLVTLNRSYHYNFKHIEFNSPCPTYLMSAGIILVGVGGSGEDKKEKQQSFLSSLKDGNLRLSRKLLKGGGVDVNCRHDLGWSGLHIAAVNGNIDVIKFLVENGADVNVKDEFSSAQRIAAHAMTSSLLVSHLRDMEFCSYIDHYQSYSGFTPLHYAVIADNLEVVKYLLENGADPSIENNRGFLPEDYTTNEDITNLLKKSAKEYQEKKKQELIEERRKNPLEKQLKEHLVGQDGPITAAAAAIRRREMGWCDDEHPMVFLFLGSSGIGKTELAKQIARYIHKGKPEGFIRIDMSEYQQKHEVAKLIGAPPGYVGHDQGGQLTAQLAKCPDAVVLFDEVEKAHPDVLTVLLQLFDEGRLTDGQGKTIECKNAMFVMTSNLASEEIASHGLQLRKEAQLVAERNRDGDKKGAEDHVEISRDFKNKVVEPILKRHFKRDEFLGRINEMLYFLPFSRTELNLLVEKELMIWKKRASKNHSIEVTWEREVLDVIADGYNVRYGARSIKHETERVAVTLLANAFEKGHLCPRDSVRLVVEPGKMEGTAVIHLKIDKKPTGTNVLSTKPFLAGLFGN